MKKKPRELVPAAKPPPSSLAPIQPAVSAKNSLLSKNTIRGYVRDWKDFFQVESIEAITVPMCLQVAPEQVASFRDRLIEQGLGPGTIARKLTALRTLFDYLVQRGMMVLNPAHPKLVRGPKRGTVKKMERLSLEEARRFLGAIDRTTPRGRRDYALIMTDLHMGLRRSEALGIRSDQFKVDGDRAYLIFRSKGEKERMVTVNQDLAAALAAYAPDRGNTPGWLFPGRDPRKPLSGDQFWRIVQGYLEAAGISKKVGTHGLRATFITHNIELGTPLSEVQKTVGHSRPETTLGYARDLEMIKSRAPKAMEGMSAPEKEQLAEELYGRGSMRRTPVGPGTRWGRLVVVKALLKNDASHVRWACVCDCGRKVEVLGYNLAKKCGNTRSCGLGECLRLVKEQKKAAALKTEP